MELRDLEYFLAIVEARSVTLAARRVHAAQPTLSHALSRLEAELGERLLERKARSPLRLTDAGEVVAARARQALSAVTALKDDLASLRGHVGGNLRIAAIQSLSATLLPRVLARLAREYPAIKPTVRTLAAESIARAVASGRADVGLVYFFDLEHAVDGLSGWTAEFFPPRLPPFGVHIRDREHAACDSGGHAHRAGAVLRGNFEGHFSPPAGADTIPPSPNFPPE